MRKSCYQILGYYEGWFFLDRFDKSGNKFTIYFTTTPTKKGFRPVRHDTKLYPVFNRPNNTKTVIVQIQYTLPQFYDFSWEVWTFQTESLANILQRNKHWSDMGILIWWHSAITLKSQLETWRAFKRNYSLWACKYASVITNLVEYTQNN